MTSSRRRLARAFRRRDAKEQEDTPALPAPDFVELATKCNRGWPWPEDSFGLGPMFGDDGWCHACGMPQRAQTGTLVLQRRGIQTTIRAWVPNWRYDTYCFSPDLASTLEQSFGLWFRPVEWRGGPTHQASQLILPEPTSAFFDRALLTKQIRAQRGDLGATCNTCGTWRWLPLGFRPIPPMTTHALPPVRREVAETGASVVVSEEWFGDGFSAFRLVLFKRELANVIAAASPRDFTVVDPDWQ